MAAPAIFGQVRSQGSHRQGSESIRLANLLPIAAPMGGVTRLCSSRVFVHAELSLSPNFSACAELLDLVFPR